MNNNIENVYTGIGKRKTSVAKVFLKEGSGNIQVNNKPFEQFFNDANDEINLLKNSFILVNLENKFDIEVIVKGGGISSQFGAISLAINKAISSINKEYRTTLSQYSLLHRDSRIKERRKYGLKKARKASQYSKR